MERFIPVIIHDEIPNLPKLDNAFVLGQQEQKATRKMRMHKCISLETMFWFYSLQIFMFQVLTLQAYTRAQIHTHTVLAYHLWAV